MKIAHIVPIPDLDLIEGNEIFLCLAHLAIKDPYYRHFYKDRAAEGKFVILDNGTAEGSRVEFEQLRQVILEIKPSEVVLPDELHNCYRSVSLAESFIEYMDKTRTYLINFNYMAVPQGDNLEEYILCSKLLSRLPIQTIGVSKFMMNKEVNRIEFLQKANLDTELSVHILGLNSLGELKALKTMKDSIRSVDTCFAALFAQNNSGFGNPNWRKKEFQFQFEVFRSQYKTNIEEMEAILRK